MDVLLWPPVPSGLNKTVPTCHLAARLLTVLQRSLHDCFCSRDVTKTMLLADDQDVINGTCEPIHVHAPAALLKMTGNERDTIRRVDDEHTRRCQCHVCMQSGAKVPWC